MHVVQEEEEVATWLTDGKDKGTRTGARPSGCNIMAVSRCNVMAVPLSVPGVGGGDVTGAFVLGA